MAKNRLLFFGFIGFFALLRILMVWSKEYTTSATLYTSTTGSRQLLDTTGSCSSKFDQNGGIVIYILGVLYTFVGLAIVCEHDFKDSLVEICRQLNLSEDIAGATFMAAGTSSPELFTALVAVWAPKDDIGVATIVGSAIFNILVIIGSAVVVSGLTLHLDWRPVLRDSLVNFVSFAYLIWVFPDGKIDWIEATVGVLIYCLYIGLMAINRHLMWLFSWLAFKLSRGRIAMDDEFDHEPHHGTAGTGSGSHTTSEAQIKLTSYLGQDSEYETDTPTIDRDAHTDLNDIDDLLEMDDDDHHFADDVHHFQHDSTDADTPSFARSVQRSASLDSEPELVAKGSTGAGTRAGDSSTSSSSPEPLSSHEHIRLPTTPLEWCWSVLSLPYMVLFKFTIPPARGKFKHQYVATFILSLAWLAVLTYLMVSWTETIGCICHIDDAVMGVTMLAIGTSMPDCLTSIAVYKTGRGNMAICNALGSNIFDIFVALALPWLLEIILFGDDVVVSSKDVLRYTLLLTIALVLFFVSMICSRWRLSPLLGWIFIACYVIWATFAVLREVGIINF